MTYVPDAGVAGLLLAAGAGRRMGRPKALVDDWLERSVAALRAGGCADVLVVLGARAEEARELVAGSGGVRIVVAEDWAEGIAASLRAGLRALADRPSAEAALVMLVDLPDVGADVVGRLAGGAGSDTLRRAVYGGRPGHPVVLGREHWAAVAASVAGDVGAGPYLKAHDAEAVECGDLADGHDVDTPRST